MNDMVVVGVLSGKGGVGKTTVTSNLASAMANVFNRKSIILDTNVSSSHIRLHFGEYDEIKKTLRDVIRDDSMLEKAVISNDMTGVDLVPSPQNLKSLDLNKLRTLASTLAPSQYDFVIIDSSPGFGDDVSDGIKASNKIVIVTNPFIPDVTDALKIMEMVKKQKRDVIVAVNRLRGKKHELDTEEIRQMLDAKDIIEIPEDDKVPESISKGVPLVVYKKGSKASMAIKRLAGLIIGEYYAPSASDRFKWFLGF